MIFADLHIHGRHAGATSPNSTISAIEKAAVTKGLDVIGTGDILHKAWFDEVMTYAKEDESTGTLKGALGLRFILSTEVECYFKVAGYDEMRQVHNLIYVRSVRDAKTLRTMLLRYGTLDLDGRPVIRLSCEQLVNYVKQVIPDSNIIPAHVWTPHTSALGDGHGFDSLKDCYQSSLRHIFAIETGLSSDPAMCSEFPDTANLTQVSNSDNHSANTARVGREATMLALKEITYDQIFGAIKTRDSRFVGTLEVPPAYGKYHLSGHRNCNDTSLDLKQYADMKGYCPECGKKATVGVLQRIHDLSRGYRKATIQKFWTVIPLSELLDKMYSREVGYNYSQRLYKSFGSEYNILLNVGEFDLTQASNERIAKVILQNRNGEIKLIPGFDNQYGKIVLESQQEELKSRTLAEIFNE